MGMAITEMDNILAFPDYFNKMINIYKSHLNPNMLKYWISLTDSSSIILHQKDNDPNYFILPDILPHGVYIKYPNNYFNDFDMLIIDPNQFKQILLQNGFQSYFSFVEDCIWNYGTYLSDFPVADTKEYKRKVYQIL